MLPIATPPHETRPWKDFQPFLKIRRHNEGLIPLWWCDIGWLAWIPSSAVEMCGAAVTCRNHSSWYFLLIPRVWNFIAFCWIYSMQHAMSHHSFKLSMQLLAVQGKHCRRFVRRLLHLGFHLPKAFQVFEVLPSMQSIWCEISYSNHMCNQLKSHGSLYNRCTQYHSVCSRKKCCASCKIESLAKRGESPLSTGEISIRCHYKYDMVQYNYNIYHWMYSDPAAIRGSMLPLIKVQWWTHVHVQYHPMLSLTHRVRRSCHRFDCLTCSHEAKLVW